MKNEIMKRITSIGKTKLIIEGIIAFIIGAIISKWLT